MSARSVIAWVAGALLVATAAAVVLVTPPADALHDPFLIRGDQNVQTRNLIATIEGASFADEVTADDWSATGNWLLVTVAASAPQTEVDATVGTASLVIDGVVFHTTERVRSSLKDAALRVGTTTVGMLAFELPEGLRAGDAELRLPAAFLTPLRDDVAVLSLDLDGLDVATSIEITPPMLGTP